MWPGAPRRSVRRRGRAPLKAGQARWESVGSGWERNGCWDRGGSPPHFCPQCWNHRERWNQSCYLVPFSSSVAQVAVPLREARGGQRPHKGAERPPEGERAQGGRSLASAALHQLLSLLWRSGSITDNQSSRSWPLGLRLLPFFGSQMRLLHSNDMGRGSGGPPPPPNPRSSVVKPSPIDSKDDLSIPRGRGPVRKGDLVGNAMAWILGGPKPR